VTLLPITLAVLVMTLFLLAAAGKQSAGTEADGGSALASDQTIAAVPAVMTAQAMATVGGRSLDLAQRPMLTAGPGKSACLKVPGGRYPAHAFQQACRRAGSNNAQRPRPRDLA
jgi:hypothetical protein